MFEEDFTNLLEAKTKCIWIKTYEEERVIQTIESLLFNNPLFTKMGIKLWDLFTGLTDINIIAEGQVREDVHQGVNPDNVLARILECRKKGQRIKQGNMTLVSNGDENIWILKDFHSLLTNSLLVRGIRSVEEIQNSSTISYNPLVIVSPVMDIPVELDKLFTVIDFDTPTSEELKPYLEAFEKKAGPISDKDKDKILDFARGLTFTEFMHYLALSYSKYKCINPDIFFQAKMDLIKKTGILDYKECHLSLEDMGGNEGFKDWINEIKMTFDPEAIKYGVEKSKGYLALGVPGTAKTLSAQMVASCLNLPMLKFDMSKIMHSHVGQSERNMENALHIIKSCSPCILLIDEAEKALSGM